MFFVLNSASLEEDSIAASSSDTKVDFTFLPMSSVSAEMVAMGKILFK